MPEFFPAYSSKRGDTDAAKEMQLDALRDNLANQVNTVAAGVSGVEFTPDSFIRAFDAWRIRLISGDHSRYTLDRWFSDLQSCTGVRLQLLPPTTSSGEAVRQFADFLLSQNVALNGLTRVGHALVGSRPSPEEFARGMLGEWADKLDKTSREFGSPADEWRWSFVGNHCINPYPTLDLWGKVSNSWNDPYDIWFRKNTAGQPMRMPARKYPLAESAGDMDVHQYIELMKAALLSGDESLLQLGKRVLVMGEGAMPTPEPTIGRQPDKYGISYFAPSFKRDQGTQQLWCEIWAGPSDVRGVQGEWSSYYPAGMQSHNVDQKYRLYPVTAQFPAK